MIANILGKGAAALEIRLGVFGRDGRGARKQAITPGTIQADTDRRVMKPQLSAFLKALSFEASNFDAT